MHGGRADDDPVVTLQQEVALALAGNRAACLATDRQGTVRRLNPAAAQMLGWPPAEAVGRGLWELLGCADAAAVGSIANPVDAVLASSQLGPAGVPLDVRTRQGTRLQVELDLALTFDAGGDAQGLIVTLRDLAPLQQAEAQGLRASRNFRLVMDAAPCGIMLVDRGGLINLVNPQGELMFGYLPGELVGQSLQVLIPAHARSQHAGLVQHFFAAASERPMGRMRDLKGLRKDGTELAVEVGLRPLQMPDGPHTLATLIDITERKRQADELRRSNADLEQFAYIASHDLQEPLRMVASYTELLAERYKGRLDEKADKYIHYAVDGARRMQRLVADLLAYARIDSQGRPLVPVDAALVLDRVVRELGPTLLACGGGVQATPLPMVLADDIQLHQLFHNLIGNALKFRAEAAPQVRVQCTADRDRWVVAVRDNGIGIDPQYADRVFQMFQRLHERGRYPGNGIGLSIARRIVERHGGRMWLESAPGAGSTFYFTLAAAPPAAASM